MVDRLEDLATNKALPAAKRRREIGRIRDLLKTEPYASMLHQSFTFHATAAADLETFWETNRLTPFEDTPSNQGSVVVLHGMGDDDQVEKLLRVWMEPHRDGTESADSIAPFEREVLTILRDISQGRPGILLRYARELFQAGAEAQVGAIDASFARDHLKGSRTGGETVEDEEYVDDVTDLLVAECYRSRRVTLAGLSLDASCSGVRAARRGASRWKSLGGGCLTTPVETRS